MTKNLLAFFLASVTASALLSSCSLFGGITLHQRPVQVSIQSDQPVGDIVNAVESLHRTDIDVQTMKRSTLTGRSALFMIPVMAFGFMLMTGIVLVFYKLYCRWLGIGPTI